MVRVLSPPPLLSSIEDDHQHFREMSFFRRASISPRLSMLRREFPFRASLSRLLSSTIRQKKARKWFVSPPFVGKSLGRRLFRIALRSFPLSPVSPPLLSRPAHLRSNSEHGDLSLSISRIVSRPLAPPLPTKVLHFFLPARERGPGR